jgi:2-polyprenyl-3-methyl-5-hydroxy-6-metoxy-1,4-benzoquinol methylase
VEVLIRRDVVGVERMRDLLHNLRLGDVWRVSGALENSGENGGKPLIVATRLECIKAWPLPGDTYVAYDRFASPPLPPLIGLPATYIEQMALESSSDNLSSLLSSTSLSLSSSSSSSSLSATLAIEKPVESTKEDTTKGETTSHRHHHHRIRKVESRSQELPLCDESWYKGIPLHKLCRRFVASKECHSKNCPHLHSLKGLDLLDEGAVYNSINNTLLTDVIIAWEKWRSRVRAMGLPVHSDDKNAGDIDHRVGHSQRASSFSSWLIKSVPPSILLSGIVLDIAGGQGDVARLLAKQGATVVTVDPRSPKRLKRKKSKSQSETATIDTQLITVSQYEELPFPFIISSQGSHTHIMTKFDDEFIRIFEEKLLSKVKLVIGFHSDEATEPIVDWAIRSSTPCCIVPCCVFSYLFPDRKLSNGCEVTSFDDFVLYLKEKFQRSVVWKEGVKTDFLEYLGANLVLHCGLEDSLSTLTSTL